MPNARNIIFICCLLKLMVFFSAVLGCRTTSESITDNAIIEYSRQLAVLENGIEEYGESVAAVRASIAAVCEEIGTVREGASSINLTVEDTIILFDAYQRAVERLLQDYGRLYARNSSATDDTID